MIWHKMNKEKCEPKDQKINHLIKLDTEIIKTINKIIRIKDILKDN